MSGAGPGAGLWSRDAEQGRRELAIVVAACASVAAALLVGVVAADITEPGGEAGNSSLGPELTGFGPQFVDNSTVDTYTVRIAQTDADYLIRQQPRATHATTQRIRIDESFGPTTDARVVAVEGRQTRFIDRSASVTGGDVVVELADTSSGKQGAAYVTAVTVEFRTQAPDETGSYDWDVEMENHEGVTSTGTAAVEVVQATGDASSLEIQDATVDAPASATQDERQMRVNATIANTDTAANATGVVVYGLAEDADPSFDGTDRLTQSKTVTVSPAGSETVTFVVDLTAADEAIDTGDDITHGVAVRGPDASRTAPLTIEDGPVTHSQNGTVNRTTGLIQTAVDISDDAEHDLVAVATKRDANGNLASYAESVTVPVDDVTIRGESAAETLVVRNRAGPVFDLQGDNATLARLNVNPLDANTDGVVAGGSGHHQLSNLTVRGGGTEGGTGIAVPGDSVVVVDTVVDNRTVGVALEGSTGTSVDHTTVVDAATGLDADVASSVTWSGGEIRGDDADVRLEGGSDARLTGVALETGRISADVTDVALASSGEPAAGGPGDLDGADRFVDVEATGSSPSLDLTMEYDDADVGNEARLSFWQYDDGWAIVDSTVDADANTISTTDPVTSFGTFGIYEGGTPFFDVAFDDPPASVTAGETAAFDLVVENTGNEADTQSLTLVVHGSAVDGTSDISLAPGESETVTLAWETESGDVARDLPVRVRSHDDVGSTRLDVREPGASEDAGGSPVSEVDGVSIAAWSVEPTAVRPGETVTVAATVRNDRGSRQVVTLEVVDRHGPIATIDVAVPAGEDRTATSEHSFDSPGSYRLGFRHAGTERVRVTDPDTDPTPTATSTADGTTDSPTATTAVSPTDDLDGFGIVVGVAALVGGALLARRRSNGH